MLENTATMKNGGVNEMPIMGSWVSGRTEMKIYGSAADTLFFLDTYRRGVPMVMV